MRHHAWLALLFLLPATDALSDNKIREGVHRIVAVVNVVSREEALKDVDHDKLEASGIAVEDIADGSFAVGIVYCCNKKISQNEKVVFYVPPDVVINNYDFVEVRVGRPAKKRRKDAGIYHRAIRSRYTPVEEAAGECRWEPGDPRMWMNVIYCDWMEEEGWLYQKGTSKSWYLPQPEAGGALGNAASTQRD